MSKVKRQNEQTGRRGSHNRNPDSAKSKASTPQIRTTSSPRLKMNLLSTWQCLNCSTTCDDEQENSIKCFTCKKWAHERCSGLNKDVFEQFCDPKQVNLEWICQKCVEAKVEFQTRQDPRIDQLLDLIPLVGALSNRLENLENNLLGEKMEEKIEQIVDRKIAEALEEQKEVETRKKNLILVNIKESSKTDIKERMEEDLSTAKEVISKLVALEPDDISDPVRLGRENMNNHPRLMRITIKTEKKKLDIQRKAPELNKDMTNKEDRIFINPDYTRKEREAHKKLREEMKKRTIEGETNLAIRKGKIVTLKQRSDDRNRGEAIGGGVRKD